MVVVVGGGAKARRFLIGPWSVVAGMTSHESREQEERERG